MQDKVIQNEWGRSGASREGQGLSTTSELGLMWVAGFFAGLSEGGRFCSYHGGV